MVGTNLRKNEVWCNGSVADCRKDCSVCRHGPDETDDGDDASGKSQKDPCAHQTAVERRSHAEVRSELSGDEPGTVPQKAGERAAARRPPHKPCTDPSSRKGSRMNPLVAPTSSMVWMSDCFARIARRMVLETRKMAERLIMSPSVSMTLFNPAARLSMSSRSAFRYTTLSIPRMATSRS